MIDLDNSRSRMVLFAGGLLACASAAVFIAQSQLDPWQSVVEGSRDAGFVLTDLKIDGANHTSRSEILAALDIDDGVPLLSIDLIRIKEQLEKLNWIKSVELKRNLPSGLHITITERVPYALWQNNGKVQLIDPDGVAITSRGLGDFTDLMILVGPNAHLHATSLQALLDTQPDLSQRVKSAVRVGERRWDVVFENGVRVKLPEDKNGYRADDAWSLFASLEQEHSLLSREVSIIDMRVKDRVYLRLPPGVSRTERSFETKT
ncbi:hypothetical protein GCM10017044_16990 [Kordiimonas sediminis]|uniref:Cell division protein FtsQ n=1 Tax=Kordiimonas sediminis TaxID=1735581 RepID=A0A919E7U7_9PROT|nr:cell division protein FtsQ/DivIB [Kordiimonas sediminis]GHF23168.1 hypothetical protein GCM10017044_16990 [Kordiimonas sediminis]